MFDGAGYRLTISIPTFNRAAFLRPLLEELFSNIGDSCVVQVLVSDNNSGDETEEICRAYGDKLNFKYIRNASNLGADRNVLSCISNADGDYVWVMGDDDRIALGAIDKVLAHIDDLQPSMIVLNGVSGGRLRVEKTSGLDVFSNFDKFFGEYGYHFTWISTTILKKCDLKFLNKDEFSVSEGFVHIGMQLKSFLKHGSFVMNFEPLVQTTDNVSDYVKSLKSMSRLFAYCLCNIVDMYKSSLSEASQKDFLMAHHYRFNMFGSSYFIRARASAALSRNEFNALRPYFRRVSRKWRWGEIVYLLPRPVFEVLARLKGVSIE